MSPTYERIEIRPVMIVKRDGARQTFDRNKIGMLKACEKRPVTVGDLETVIDRITDHRDGGYPTPGGKTAPPDVYPLIMEGV